MNEVERICAAIVAEGGLTREETVRVLETCEHRVGTVAWWGANVEINYGGQWRVVARTDWKDDVCTGRPEWTIEQWRQEAKESYGARLRDTGTFAIVDRFSDG